MSTKRSKILAAEMCAKLFQLWQELLQERDLQKRDLVAEVSVARLELKVLKTFFSQKFFRLRLHFFSVSDFQKKF